MSTAKHIVEAEIGPQDDMEQFVRQALPVDFFLDRLQLAPVNGPGGRSKKQVIDIETGVPLCILRELPTLDERRWEWGVDAAGTMSVMRKELKYDPGFAMAELGRMTNMLFHSWQAAVAYLLRHDATKAYVEKLMKLKLESKHISAFYFTDKLLRLRENLIKQDFLVQRMGRVTDQGTRCLVTGVCDSLDVEEVLGKIKYACLQEWTYATNAKAALRNENGLWQLDFRLPELFEGDDIDNFVTTAFRDQVPGYKELERATNLRDTLRHMGLPVTRLLVTTYVAYYHGEPDPNAPIVATYKITWDNKVVNLSKSKSLAILTAALGKLKIRLQDYSVKITGHGAARSMLLYLNAMEPVNTANHSLCIESEENDFAEFAEVAASKSGTIGDELRLKRLVKFLKAYGMEIGFAKLRQKPDFGINPLRSYLTVEYTLDNVHMGTLSPVIGQVTPQVTGLIMRFLRMDQDITDMPPPPEYAIKITWGGRDVARIEILVESLRKTHEQEPRDMPMDRIVLTPEELAESHGGDDIEDVASIGLKARMLIHDLKKEMERRGYTVRNVLAHHPTTTIPMTVFAHINAYNDDPEFAVRINRDNVLFDWVQATQAYGGQKQSVIPTVISDSHVITLRAEVPAPEPQVTWVNAIKESIISTTDMGQALVLTGIINKIEAISRDGKNYTPWPIHVLWAKAEPMSASLGWPQNSVCVTIRVTGRHPDDGLAAFTQALSDLDLNDDIIYREVNERTLGLGERKRPDANTIDYYVVLKAADDLPLLKPLKVKGPSFGRYMDSAEDGEINESEQFDPDSEAWVQKSINQFSGYKDRERLKKLGKCIQRACFNLVGISQTPRHSRADRERESQEHTGLDAAVVEVLIAVKRQSDLRPSGVAMSTSALTDYNRMRKAIEADEDISRNEILDFRFEYDTMENTSSDDPIRVFLLLWRSFDAPTDIQPLSLRHGEWNEWAKVFHDPLAKMFLVEHLSDPDAPVEESEEDPEMAAFFAGAEDQVDPLWRERISLQAIASDLHTMGYGGCLRLTTGSNKQRHDPYLFVGLVSYDQSRLGDEAWNAVTTLLLKHKATLPAFVADAKHCHPNYRTAELNVSPNGNYYTRNFEFRYTFTDDTYKATVPKAKILPGGKIGAVPPSIPFDKMFNKSLMVKIGENMDPAELVQKANKTSVYGAIQALTNMAQQLAEAGMAGYIYCRPLQVGTGNACVTVRVVRPSGNPITHSVIRPLANAIVAPYPKKYGGHGATTDYMGFALKGYTPKDAIEQCHWCLRATLRLPGIFTDSNSVQIDIQTGALQTADTVVGWDEV